MWSVIHFLCFIVAFKFGSIYYATSAIMTTILLEVLHTKLKKKEIKKNLKFTFFLVWVFGLLTLLLRDPYFIMIKPTILYVFLGLFVLVSELSGKSFLLSILNSEVSSEKTGATFNPKKITLFSYIFIGSQFLLAALNYYYATYTTEDTWLNFKIYSSILLSIFIFSSIMLIGFWGVNKKNT